MPSLFLTLLPNQMKKQMSTTLRITLLPNQVKKQMLTTLQTNLPSSLLPDLSHLLQVWCSRCWCIPSLWKKMAKILLREMRVKEMVRMKNFLLVGRSSGWYCTPGCFFQIWWSTQELSGKMLWRGKFVLLVPVLFPTVQVFLLLPATAIKGNIINNPGKCDIRKGAWQQSDRRWQSSDRG